MGPRGTVGAKQHVKDNRERGPSAIRSVIAVLRCFTAQDPLQGVTEIAVQVGLHKSSVSRILATLEEERIVERDESTRKFRLGLGLITVAGPLLAHLDVRRISLPVLQEISRTSEETSALVVWNGDEAVTVEQVPSPRQVKHTTPLGTRYYTALNASVRTFLAHLVPEDLTQWLDRSGSPAGGYAGLDNLMANLEKIRACGSALNRGLTSPDEVGICSPVRDHRGEVVAGVMILAPEYRIGDEVLDNLNDVVLAASLDISRRLGHAPAGGDRDRELLTG